MISDIAFFRISLIVWIVLNIILGFVGNYPTLHLPAAIGSVMFWFFAETTLFVFRCLTRIPRMTMRYQEKATCDQALIDAIIADAKKGTVFKIGTPTPPKKPRPLANEHLVNHLDQLAEKGFVVREYTFLTEYPLPGEIGKSESKRLTAMLDK